MVDYNLIADIGIDLDQADALIREALGDDVAGGDMDSVIIGISNNLFPAICFREKLLAKLATML